MKGGWLQRWGFKTLNRQLALLFVGLVGTVLGLFAWLAYNLASFSLESELGKRLVTVATVSSASSSAEDLAALKPGGQAAARVRQRLQQAAEDLDVESLSVISLKGLVLVDSQSQGEGQAFNDLALDATEWASALRGSAKATPLFRGSGGRLYKSAYAPLRNATGQVLAVARASASADFLAVIKRYGAGLAVLSFASLLLALLMAAVAARPVVRPLRELIEASRRVAAGDFGARVDARRQDELGEVGRTFNEMTERLGAMVTERERLATLGELASGVAHEIRNPLQAIVGFSELAGQRLKPNDPRRAHLAAIREEVRVADKVLSDLLDYAKPNTARAQAVDPLEAARAAVAVVFPGAKQSTWKVQWESRARLKVRADRDQLRQILVNMLKNAREACPKGGPIRIGVARRGREAQVWVEDQGKGISAEARGRLFEPFFTTKPMGTGLGLSIALKIAQSYGGQLEAEGSPGKGARFTLTLPLARERGA